ncbi:MAG TPA: hypothetical protein PLF50_04290 [Candidatus Cloacimonadota bacterium]|nr:hypothetical protein [Candidatus Cloacimonadota bacterium]
MFAKLKNEKGVTLIEVMATAIIVAGAIIALYTGIIYADKQVLRNYHDRVATLHASGELEWQMYYKKNYKVFDEYNYGKTVIIDRLKRGNLNGIMTMKVYDRYETPFGSQVPYKSVVVAVTWTEPGDKTARRIVVEEDFY